jgi:hypothetical protein
VRLYIPTRGRPEQQITLRNLPDAILKRAALVVDEAELDQYKPYANQAEIIAVPAQWCNGIGRKRQFIVDQHDVSKYGPKVVMADDDLGFYKRRSDDPTKFKNATPGDVISIFKQLESLLDQYVHVSLLQRSGANRITEPLVEVSRPLAVLGYDVSVLRRHDVRFDRVSVMEDFDVCLQLLRLGYKNCVLAKYIHSQGPSNAAGGCSTYRTHKVQTEGALRLNELHPAFVRVVTKTTKAAWGGGKRTDVIVSWKRAYEESIRPADPGQPGPEMLTEQQLKSALKSTWKKYEKPAQLETAPLLYWLRIRLRAPGARNDISDKDRGFGAWVDDNLGISRRTADRWADAYGEANGLIERETTSSQLTKGLDLNFYEQEIERHRTQVQVKYLHCWVSPEKHKQYQRALNSVREYFKVPNDKIAIFMGVQYAAKAIAARLRTGNFSKRTPAKRAGLGASSNAGRTGVGQTTHARRADVHRTVHQGVVQSARGANGHRGRKGPVTSAGNAGRKAFRAAAG